MMTGFSSPNRTSMAGSIFPQRARRPAIPKTKNRTASFQEGRLEGRVPRNGARELARDRFADSPRIGETDLRSDHSEGELPPLAGPGLALGIQFGHIAHFENALRQRLVAVVPEDPKQTGQQARSQACLLARDRIREPDGEGAAVRSQSGFVILVARQYEGHHLEESKTAKRFADRPAQVFQRKGTADRARRQKRRRDPMVAVGDGEVLDQVALVEDVVAVGGNRDIEGVAAGGTRVVPHAP